jgi:fatty acid desaturase
VPDYSEFPTTPTAWQENLWPEPLSAEPIEPSQPEPGRRPTDRISLVIGVAFSLLAILVLAGVPIGWLGNGGLLWIALIGTGAALLATEVRRARHRR